MSRITVYDALLGEHDEFHAIYEYDEVGFPLRIKSLKRKRGKRKTVPQPKNRSALLKILGVKSICDIAEETLLLVEVKRNTPNKRRRRQLVGGKR